MILFLLGALVVTGSAEVTFARQAPTHPPGKFAVQAPTHPVGKFAVQAPMKNPVEAPTPMPTFTPVYDPVPFSPFSVPAAIDFPFYSAAFPQLALPYGLDYQRPYSYNPYSYDLAQPFPYVPQHFADFPMFVA